MCYRTNDHFRQGAPVCPNEKRPKTATNQPVFLYHSLPAPTATVAISTASIRATSRWLNGWAKPNPSGGYTARPAAHASANEKARSCKTPSYPPRRWRALSNVSATAVLLRQQQTSVKWILAASSVCWKEPVNAPPISIVCNSKTLTSLSMRCRWMNCTAKQSRANATPKRLRLPKDCVNASVKKGQDVASYGSGREEQVSSRIAHWATHASDGHALDRLGGDLCQRQAPSADLDRRSSAVPASAPSGFWTDQTPPSQKRQRQTQASPSQTACRFAGGRCEEDTRQSRQFVEGIDRSIVWQKETDRKAYSRPGHRTQDQHLSYGTAQRHDKGPTGSFGSAYPQWLSSGDYAAIFRMAVAGLVQLDQGALLAVG